MTYQFEEYPTRAALIEKLSQAFDRRFTQGAVPPIDDQFCGSGRHHTWANF